MKEINVFGMPYKILATAEETGGKFGLIEATASTEKNSPHIHSTEDEAFYVLEGKVEFQIGSEARVGVPGTFVYGPKGLPHTFRGTSEIPAKLLIWVTPGGFERFFSEIDGITNVALVRQIAERYGLSYPDQQD